MNSITRLVQWMGWALLIACSKTVAAPAVMEPSRPSALLPYTHTELALQTPLQTVQDGGPGQRLTLTRWHPSGSSAWGVSLGLRGNALAIPVQGVSTSPLQQALQVGLHWRSRLDARSQWSISGWADWLPAGGGLPRPEIQFGGRPDAYTAQLQWQWESARYGGLIPEYGAIGVRLQSGSRLMLRARHGGPMIYYRMRF